MKKNILIIFILGVILSITNVNATTKADTLYEACKNANLECNNITNREYNKDLPNVYLFIGDNCKYCDKLLTYLSSINNKYINKINFVIYNITNNEDNSKMYSIVAKKFGDTAEGYPYMIISKKIYDGYSDTYNESIEEVLDAMVTSPNSAYDVVKDISNGNLDPIVNTKKSNTTLKRVLLISLTIIVILGIVIYSINNNNNTRK